MVGNPACTAWRCHDFTKGALNRAEGSVAEMAETYNGYCVKCREKRDFQGEVKELANGSRAAQGECPVCGTKMTRMLPKNG